MDIEKGTLWFEELRNELVGAKAGVICLTPESLDSGWIHFEAGIISKTVDSSSEDSKISTPEKGFTSIFTYLLDIGAAELNGPLAMYQSTTTASFSDSRRMLNAIIDLLPEEEKASVPHWEQLFNSHWPTFKAALADIPNIDLVKIYSDFENLFKRKTFIEPIVDCLNQQWLARYDGAKETRFKLLEHQSKVRSACRQFVKDAYTALIAELDAYAMNVSLLIGSKRFGIAEKGHLEIEPPGIANACERNRKKILKLVALITDPKQAPQYDDAFKFDEMEVFAEKKKLIHNTLEDMKKVKAKRSNKDQKKVQQLVGSDWDFERIIYYELRKNAGGLKPAEELRRSKREWLLAKSDDDRVKLMPFYYSLGPLLMAAENKVEENERNSIIDFIKTARKYIEEHDLDKGGQVRERLDEIEDNLVKEAAR